MMGYETVLLIGEDTGHRYNEDGDFFIVHATVDLCKMGDSELFNLDWVNKTPEVKRSYWYAPTGDGNTVVCEDRYGDIPKPVPLDQVVDALRCDILNNDRYRRLHWALALCEAMLEKAGGKGFSVLMWGY
jgi:hypothetical protein